MSRLLFKFLFLGVLLIVVTIGFTELIKPGEPYTLEFVDMETNKVFLTIDEVTSHKGSTEDGQLVFYYTSDGARRHFVVVNQDRTFTARKQIK